MRHIDTDEKPMIRHAAEVMNDRIHNDVTGYTDAATRAVLHLDELGKTETSVLVVTGAKLDHATATAMFQRIVRTELKHWVPDASQRLLHRAGHALGVRHPVMLSDAPDCGAEPGWHALVGDWVAGIFVRRCVTCCRLFADGTPE